jgi:hypothetical protein
MWVLQQAADSFERPAFPCALIAGDVVMLHLLHRQGLLSRVPIIYGGRAAAAAAAGCWLRALDWLPGAWRLGACPACSAPTPRSGPPLVQRCQVATRAAAPVVDTLHLFPETHELLAKCEVGRGSRSRCCCCCCCCCCRCCWPLAWGGVAAAGAAGRRVRGVWRGAPGRHASRARPARWQLTGCCRCRCPWLAPAPAVAVQLQGRGVQAQGCAGLCCCAAVQGCSARLLLCRAAVEGRGAAVTRTPAAASGSAASSRPGVQHQHPPPAPSAPLTRFHPCAPADFNSKAEYQAAHGSDLFITDVGKYDLICKASRCRRCRRCRRCCLQARGLAEDACCCRGGRSGTCLPAWPAPPLGAAATSPCHSAARPPAFPPRRWSPSSARCPSSRWAA